MNKKQLEILRKKLNAEEVGLPESLSAENMEKLINEHRDVTVVTAVQETPPRKPIVFKRLAYAAAVIVMIAALAAVSGLTVRDIELRRQEDVISEKVQGSDYSKIEKLVLSHYKNVYNEQRQFTFTIGSSNKDTAAENMAPGAAMPDEAMNAGTGTILGGISDTEDNKTFSATNVQVSGVDEGDIIKNDGRYLYCMSKKQVIIVDAKDPDNLVETARIDMYDQSVGEQWYYNSDEMYIYNDKLVLITRDGKEMPSAAADTNGPAYDCCIEFYIETDTYVRVYDIADRTAPKLEYSFKTDGDFVSSRLINGKLLAVSTYSIPYRDFACNGEFKDFESSCDELKKSAVPSYSVNGGESRLIDAENIEILNEEEPTEYVIITQYDLNGGKEITVKATLCGSYEFYCTANNLFLAECEYSYWSHRGEYNATDDSGDKFESVTHIHKYDITNEGVFYKTTATVGGTPLNQFSMDEYNGMFRIATNGLKNGKETRETFVYVLDGDMKTVGTLGGIAKGETMKASRFIGNTLYLVTFYQTDPLFIIDLSDPTAPKIQGELKIPGFSSYLHPLDNGLMIGIGEGGTDSGLDNSAKISLFDVSDPKKPKEISKFTVPSAYLDASHKAYTVIDEDSFAVCIRKYGHDAEYNYRESQSVMVFDVADGELKLHGEYACKTFGQYYSIDNLRSAFIGDTIFAVSDCGIIAYNMTDNHKRSEISFING